MEEQKLVFTSNGYDYLESYTKQLYGERGSFQHNLQRYLCSDEFRLSCRAPKNVDEIPEVSFSDIQNQINRELFFQNLSSQTAEKYTQLVSSKEITTVDEYAYAGIMGLCPGQCDWYDTLFPHLVDLFVSSEEEGEQILKNIEKLPNIVSVMVSVMTDGIRNHQVIHVNGHDIYSKGYARNYFRGESAYYGESKPSLFRNMPEDPLEKKIHIVLGELRMIEFAIWMNRLSFVDKWPFGDVFHGAIAQHYGIPTNGMDVTSDLKTALFFACCRYENGTWRPLRADEFANADSRKSIAGKGGDSRYGILFAAPVDVANMSRAANIPSLHLTYATPIGYQPFMRCASQSGVLIEAGEPYDMYYDPSFKKIKFRHTEEICNWIFKEMQEGALIYPNESFGVCDDIVERIKETKQFTQKAFQIVLRRLKLESEEDSLREILQQRGYAFLPEIAWCTDERIQELESGWAKNVGSNPQLQAIPRSRFGFTIGQLATTNNETEGLENKHDSL